MEENNNLNKENSFINQNNKNWWRPVLFFYVKTTSWIIFPLILAMLAGKYVSSSFGSQTLFFVFVMLGFGITCFGVYREIKQYKKSLEKK